MNIQDTISNLQNLTELDIQNNWFYLDRALNKPPLMIDDNWQQATVNEKKYLVWEKGDKIRWFAQKIVIPESLNKGYSLADFSLRIALTWWAKSAQIFVNNQLVCEGDLFDSSSRILVTERAYINQQFIISLRLVSPSHDIGGLMASRCIYESNYEDIDPSFVANELTILDKYIDNFYPEKKDFLATQINKINWDYINNKILFNQELANLRNNLLSLSNHIKERQFYLLGHAHLDMAWLWTLEETYEVAQRTFNSVLNLQKKYPYLMFGHTTAYLYQWIESHNSLLFRQIEQAVQNNQWEILGGMWVEPDVNLISGESLVRQLLYGQKYFLKKFGKYNTVAWLPDTFGFPWQLPQILQQAEINYFVTGKLHWNDTTKFPHGCFWWQSPDGSRIFSFMSPPNVAGVMDTNPITMTNYSVDWEKQTGLQDIFWLPGVGDHGGGPTRDMLEVAKRYDNSPFFPQINFTSAQQYLDKISSISDEKLSTLPLWNNELYLELHRGCYTTHGDQKYQNRYAERLLYQAELFSTIALILAQKFNLNFSITAVNNQQYNAIKENWQKVLLNQFHDILPGTSITPVFEDANQLWQEVIADTQHILKSSLSSIEPYINIPKIDCKNYQIVIIFNSLNWHRSQIVELEINSDKNYQILDDNQQILETQISHEGKLLFLAENIPSIGYKSFYLRENLDIDSRLPSKNKFSQTLNNNSTFILENSYIIANIDNKTGNLIMVYDKVNNQEILKGFGNELQLFDDKGQYWDAWNIDPNYENYPLESPSLISIQWLEKGSLRQIIRVEKTFNRSSFIQDYILNYNEPILTINNKVNWQEDYTLLKVNFPLNIESDFVTYDIACGNIQRTTKPETEAEKAQWEVPAHFWADLSNNDYGVSLLNNCKYGYDTKPNQLRLSLLRSPKWPDEKCDRAAPLGDRNTPLSYHQFSYSLYPHEGDWKKANTVKKAYELNTPLNIILRDNNINNNEKLSCLPSSGELINLGAVGTNNIILMALKTTENDPNKFLIRGYECHGESANLEVNGLLNLDVKTRVNLLENSIDNQTTQIQPYQIFNYILH
ncbi:alpha-mannosidase [Geminocystis herdmanii]|uniref:alpha-mannosidase n=1 Tax=Geminocystis herdmanii TaxID=669359 RepID=UPI00034831B0|nr:alpha-mannosidase [Geminocystis herdmanii]